MSDPDRAAAFTSLYDAAYTDVLRFAQRRTHPTLAEDAVADAFLAVWRRLDDLPADPGDARAWLFGVCRGTLLNTRRGQQRQDALAVRLADAPTAFAVDTDLVVEQVDLSRAWVRLTAVHQETLCLAVLDGLTSSQAAAVLGISPVAFRLRLTRARRALRAHLAHTPDPRTTRLPADSTEGSLS